MRKILTGTIFVLIIGLTACGRSEPHDVIDNATQAQENIGGVPLESSPEPQESEPEPTHTTYTIHGLTLEMPVDWQAFRHPTYDQIWIHPPSDAPRRRDQTRVQISSEPIGGYVADIDEWLAGFIDPAGPPPLTILGGVEAFDGRMRGVVGDDGVLFGVDSFFIDENARGQHFQVFHNRRFYFIRFLTADGEHWETLEQIRASMIFAGGTANHTGIGYVRETTETWQEAFEETLRFYSNLSLRDWETGWIFALHDINRDGVPELFLAMEQITGHVYYRYIYAFTNGEIVSLEFEGYMTGGTIFAHNDNSPWIFAFLAAGSGGHYVKLEMSDNKIVPILEAMAFMSEAGHEMMLEDEDFDWRNYEWYDITINGNEATADEFERIFAAMDDRNWIPFHEATEENIRQVIFN